MKIINKLASAVLASVISLSAMACFGSAFAEDIDGELTDGTFKYELVNGSYTIIDCDVTAIMTEIPEMCNGYAITAIGDEALAGCEYIAEIKIPSTVKSIGQYAFAGCTGATKVVIPDSVTEIPTGAFAGCSSLKEVEMSDGVTTIGARAFYNCPSLETINIPEGVSVISDYAFHYCYAIKELDLPSTLESIGEMAFADCASIEKITCDDNKVFTVENNVLYNKDKTKLYRASSHNIDENFYVPDTVKEILAGSFSYCTELTNLYLPASVQSVGDLAFNFCVALKDIDFSEGLSSLGNLTFSHCTALESLSLPTTLASIGEACFWDCAVLEKVILSEGITTVGPSAFLACPKLNNILVPKSVANVGEQAFGYIANADGTEYELKKDFSMSVYSGSSAEKYAKSADIDCTVVDRSLKHYAFIVIAVGAFILAVVLAVVLMRKGRKSPDSKKDKDTADDEDSQPYDSILGDDEE